MTNYLLAGGGTAGHINPLLALADEIRRVEPSAKILALGTVQGLEVDLVPRRGIELRTIAKLPFPRRFNTYAFKFPFAFAEAVRACRRILRDEAIDVLVGFGGYASAPAYLAAKLSNVPIVVHEANALPGWANKLGNRFASATGTAFKQTPLKGSIQVGMPLRREIVASAGNSNKSSARKIFGLKPDVTTLLVTGGSLGARRINETVEGARKLFSAAGIQVLHIVGGGSDLSEEKSSEFVRLKYCNQMSEAIAAADFAISRAGASTVSEFTAVGLPALYVPYPVGNGEQKLNAVEVVSNGGAEIVADADFTVDFVAQNIVPLMSNPKLLAQMAIAARSVGILDGTERLLAMVRGALK